jgi:hypothetical protein
MPFHEFVFNGLAPLAGIGIYQLTKSLGWSMFAVLIFVLLAIYLKKNTPKDNERNEKDDHSDLEDYDIE